MGRDVSEGRRMSLLVSPALAKLRRVVPWSNTRQAWAERAALAGLVTLGVALARFGGTLNPPQQFAASLVAGGLALVLLQRGWVKLFGPVLFYEMLRGGRRAAHVVLRTLYAGIVLYILLVVYLVWLATVARPDESTAELLSGRSLPARRLADFSSMFLMVYLAVQTVVAFVLTPAYTAGAVAAERERGTLVPLLGTDLSSHEVVLSMLASRLANLSMVLLTGLPILSIMEFVGGVDPGVVWAGFAATVVSMLSLGSLGLWNSIRAEKPRAAMLRTYLLAMTYLAASGASLILLAPSFGLASFPSTPTWTSPVTLDDVAGWLNAGNPFTALGEIANGLSAGAALDAVLPGLLRRYVVFHLAVTAICLAWSVARLRAWTLHVEATGTRAQRDLSARSAWRHSWPLAGLLDARPMLWKELTVATGAGRMSLLGSGLLLAATMAPVIHYWYAFGGSVAAGWWTGASELINLWVRLVTALVGSLMLVSVAVRAAGSVTTERARGTLDSLMATPLTGRTVLSAKWWGSIFASRVLLLLLGLVWAVGLATGAVSAWAVPCFLVTWFVQAAFVASLGLYFSMYCRTAARASLCTVIAIFLAVAFSGLLVVLSGVGAAAAVIPPVALASAAFGSGPWGLTGNYPVPDLAFVAGAALFWLIFAVMFRALAQHRFWVVTGGVRDTSGESDADRLTSVLSPKSPPAPAPAPLTRRAFGWSEKGRGETAGVRLARWRRRVTVAILLLLPLALVFAVYSYLSFDVDARLVDAIAEADRLDPGWRWEELEARRKQIPPERNSAAQALKAAGLIPEKWSPAERPSERAVPHASPLQQLQLSGAYVVALRDGLRRARRALVEARKLVAMPEGGEALDPKLAGPFARAPQHQGARPTVALLHDDVLLRAQDGDIDGAMQSCRAALNAARSVGDEPAMSSQTLRIALRSEALGLLQRILAAGEPSEKELAAFQRLLEVEAQAPVLLLCARGDRASMDRWLQSQHARRASFAVGAGGGLSGRLGDFFPSSLIGLRAQALHLHTQAVEIAKLPIEQQSTAFQVFAATVPRSALVLSVTSGTQAWFIQRVRDHEARLRAAIVMVAVERYRRAHGQWPASLAELVPEFLGGVPVDPYDGQPVRYRRAADTVVVYAVGPNLADDGGAVELDPRMPGSDVGYRLWDVGSRRQPPAKEPPVGR